ncbi:collagen alpha-1(XII) chain-like [Mercenaria mercenaria]|uniref:collagen alpha-1(XII) chain-like n=1 Tax=Mercenaria mercenaria TaxID=6596 RepID=UPI00234F6232|nr:collagen alpha-1(XII) chain-like [Mercenaria mercenaria]
MVKKSVNNKDNSPVGIGSSVDPKELRMIASDSNHTFQVSSFDALNTIQNKLTSTACKACNTMISNVCFVLHSSGSERAVNFHKQLEFVNMVVNEFSFEHGAKTHVCLITFASGAFHEIHLRQYHDKNSIMTNVLKVPWRNGETMTNAGLNAAKQELSHSQGNKVAIVLTDGLSNKPALTIQAANSLHRLGIETFAVGIGRRVNDHELEVIASNKRHVFKVGTFDQLAQINQRLVNRICATARRQQTKTTTTLTTKRPHTTRKHATEGPSKASTATTLAPATATTVPPAASKRAKFSIDTNDVRFSVVSFSSGVRNEFFFNKYNSRQSVLHAIHNIQYIGQGTNTSGALNFVGTQTLLPANGARSTSSKFVVVITNGRSDNQALTKHEAQLLQKQAEVISVGIKPVDDRAELASIASNHLVETGNSDALIKIIKTRLSNPVYALEMNITMNGIFLCFLVIGTVCYSVNAIDKACPFKPVDIIFVLDGSGSEGQKNFDKQLDFVSNITEQFEIGENDTRVALVTFSTAVHNEFDLNRYYNKTVLLSHIAKARYYNGETNTHLALQYVRVHTLNRYKGAERNVTKLVIVLTDGRSLESIERAARDLKGNPLVTTIAVGIGSSVDPKELRMIASDSNHTFQVSSFDVLDTIQNEVTDTACNACNNIQSDVCFVLDSSGSEGAVNFHK